ncbi:hypothetical protein [Nonomuraea rubra]|uniref:hypothetical protein n=1 Tax=Nonomuraea rubra TaxID=46180 RepID=UPI0033E0F4E3
MVIQLTMRQAHGLPLPASPVDGIRIMALLPAGWHKDLEQATGAIVIRVRPDEPLTSAQVGDRVREILASPEVDRWELVGCHRLVTRDVREDDR